MTYTQPPQEQAFDDFLRPQTNLVHAFNVTAYGARGDKSIDSTNAFQAALNAASTDTPTGTTGDVYVPFGTYLCGAITIASGVRLIFANGAKLVAPAALATSWVTFASGTHDGTSIVNGTFDSSNVTSTSVTAVLSCSATSLANIYIRRNKLITPPVHGIYVHETTATAGRKQVLDNTVTNSGAQATGFGIYGDFAGNLDIIGNYVTSTTSDCIELGNAGTAHLGLDAAMRCISNTTSGPINYPHSDGVLIMGNTVIGSTIQNDENTANFVQIIGNKVLAATPASGFGGISCAGDGAVIVGNSVELVAANAQVGIGGTGQTLTNSIVADNFVHTRSSSATGTGIQAGNGNVVSNNLIRGNVITGKWSNGIAVATNSQTIEGNTVDANVSTGIFVLTGGTLGFNVANLNLINNDLHLASTPLSLGGAYAPQTWTIRANLGFNPLGPAVGTKTYGGTPAVPASTSVFTNPTGADCDVVITAAAGGTCAVAIGGTAVGTLPASGIGSFRIPASQTITLTYGAGNAPTWVWSGD